MKAVAVKSSAGLRADVVLLYLESEAGHIVVASDTSPTGRVITRDQFQQMDETNAVGRLAEQIEAQLGDRALVIDERLFERVVSTSRPVRTAASAVQRTRILDSNAIAVIAAGAAIAVLRRTIGECLLAEVDELARSHYRLLPDSPAAAQFDERLRNIESTARDATYFLDGLRRNDAWLRVAFSLWRLHRIDALERMASLVLKREVGELEQSCERLGASYSARVRDEERRASEQLYAQRLAEIVSHEIVSIAPSSATVAQVWEPQEPSQGKKKQQRARELS